MPISCGLKFFHFTSEHTVVKVVKVRIITYVKGKCDACREWIQDHTSKLHLRSHCWAPSQHIGHLRNIWTRAMFLRTWYFIYASLINNKTTTRIKKKVFLVIIICVFCAFDFIWSIDWIRFYLHPILQSKGNSTAHLQYEIYEKCNWWRSIPTKLA